MPTRSRHPATTSRRRAIRAFPAAGALVLLLAHPGAALAAPSSAPAAEPAPDQAGNGSIKIEKRVTGPRRAIEDPEAFKLTYACATPAGDLLSDDLTLREGQASGPVTVPTESECVVAETGLPDLAPGYRWLQPSYEVTGATGRATSGAVSFIVPEAPAGQPAVEVLACELIAPEDGGEPGPGPGCH